MYRREEIRERDINMCLNFWDKTFMLVFDIGKHSLQDFSTHVTGNGAVPRITLTLCNYSTFLKKTKGPE
mgnify:CR=1 FL=1